MLCLYLYPLVFYETFLFGIDPQLYEGIMRFFFLLSIEVFHCADCVFILSHIFFAVRCLVDMSCNWALWLFWGKFYPLEHFGLFILILYFCIPGLYLYRGRCLSIWYIAGWVHQLGDFKRCMLLLYLSQVLWCLFSPCHLLIILCLSFCFQKGVLVFDVAQFDGILKKITEFNNALLSDSVCSSWRINHKVNSTLSGKGELIFDWAPD